MIFEATIDRLESKKAILIVTETKDTFEVPLKLLPKEVKEGDIIKVSFEIYKSRTKEVRKETSEFIERLSQDK